MAGIQPDAVAMAEQAAGLERVIRVLDDRIRADRELITKYDLEAQMLAVEIEALDIILGDAEGALAVRLAELEALEEEIEESDRRRSAELELERFLGEVAA
jgi:regulator of RNase E activity RraA